MNNVQSAILDADIGWLILAGFSVLWIFLGRYRGRKATELEDYMPAGRRIGLALGVATAMDTWVTSNTIMTAPQLTLISVKISRKEIDCALLNEGQSA